MFSKTVSSSFIVGLSFTLHNGCMQLYLHRFPDAFIGAEESVGEAVKESDAELADLLTDEEREALEEMENGDYAESDEHIRDMITLVLGDLDAEGKIYCDCGVPKDLIVENGPDYVELSCKKCGCKRTFYCNNSLSTEELFDAAELRLYK